jgi:hypothetical protein
MDGSSWFGSNLTPGAAFKGDITTIGAISLNKFKYNQGI